jgi:2-keto-4-pentenoate hydratase/2-oxohepta-3-ene-1,7-dioic acid hydratase in catechol pathway
VIPPVDEAEDYIAGYTPFDNFRSRATQMAEVQGRLTPAKGKEFANALGPYLTTANTIDITEARMKATGNGGKWSEEIPDHMEHSFAEIVSYISQSETLYLDDVAGSGTVGEGCGLELGSSRSSATSYPRSVSCSCVTSHVSVASTLKRSVVAKSLAVHSCPMSDWLAAINRVFLSKLMDVTP